MILSWVFLMPFTEKICVILRRARVDKAHHSRVYGEAVHNAVLTLSGSRLLLGLRRLVAHRLRILYLQTRRTHSYAYIFVTADSYLGGITAARYLTFKYGRNNMLAEHIAQRIGDDDLSARYINCADRKVKSRFRLDKLPRDLIGVNLDLTNVLQVALENRLKIFPRVEMNNKISHFERQFYRLVLVRRKLVKTAENRVAVGALLVLKASGDTDKILSESALFELEHEKNPVTVPIVPYRKRKPNLLRRLAVHLILFGKPFAQRFLRDIPLLFVHINPFKIGKYTV